MKISKIIANTGEWLSGDGPNRQIVVTSRVRLARNIKGKPFPGWAKKAERMEVLKIAKAAVMQLPAMDDAFSENLEALSPLEKQVLVERHLISREHAAKGVGSAVVMNAPQSLSFMINEEDHLRMQEICCGLQAVAHRRSDRRGLLRPFHDANGPVTSPFSSRRTPDSLSE